MLIHDDPRQASCINKSLKDLNFDTCCIAAQPINALKQISEQAPDILIVDMPSPGRDILECLAIVATHHPMPVVMFSDEKDPEYITRAVDAGVCTYLIGSIDPPNIKPIIAVAVAQFQHAQKLRQTLEQNRLELSERRAIDQAKIKVMRVLKVDESQAYKHLRKEAMNCGLSIAAISKKVMDATVT